MEVTVNEKGKIVEIWLTNAENEDHELHEILKPFYSECKAKGLLTAVFLSGKEDLYTATSDLLCYNKKRIAELEAARKKTEKAMPQHDPIRNNKCPS